MKKCLFFLMLFGLFALNLSAQTVANPQNTEMPPDFKSDNCTFFPDGKYADCCVEHDKAYYFGGSYSARRKADNKLFKCVASKRGLYPKLIAPFMWVGVRIFGTSLLPTDFRWGFGKNKPKKPKKTGKKENSKHK